jgi:hypothetical protein
MASCATIISGSRQRVPITSDPPGATVYVDFQNVGYTPLMVKLKRKHTHQIRLELDNYSSYELTTKKKFNPMFVGNVVIGGLIGMGIDGASGAIFDVYPKNVKVKLEPSSNSSSSNSDSINIGNDKKELVLDTKTTNLSAEFMGDKESLFDLFQKSEHDHFFVNIDINEDGSIDQTSFKTDDKYIENIKESIYQELKFIPAKFNSNGEWKPMKTNVTINFSLIESKKISDKKTVLDVEKTTKNNEVIYVVKKYPEGFNESSINNLIDCKALLKYEKDGIYEFSINKYHVKGTIRLKNNSSVLFKKESDIIKFKYKKFVYE